MIEAKLSSKRSVLAVYKLHLFHVTVGITICVFFISRNRKLMSLPSVKLLLQSKLAAFLTNLSFFFFNLFFYHISKVARPVEFSFKCCREFEITDLW